MSNATYQSRPDPPARASDDEDSSIDSSEVLTMLGDEYARDILKMISADALPARELAERLNLSRATVYRRLNRLESAGVIKTTVSYNPEGHHRKRFKADFDRLVLSIDTDQINVDCTA